MPRCQEVRKSIHFLTTRLNRNMKPSFEAVWPFFFFSILFSFLPSTCSISFLGRLYKHMARLHKVRSRARYQPCLWCHPFITFSIASALQSNPDSTPIQDTHAHWLHSLLSQPEIIDSDIDFHVKDAGLFFHISLQVRPFSTSCYATSNIHGGDAVSSSYPPKLLKLASPTTKWRASASFYTVKIKK